MIAGIYIAIALWLAIGLAVAFPFAILGAQSIVQGRPPLTPGARALLVPGAAVLWPFVLWRWLRTRT